LCTVFIENVRKLLGILSYILDEQEYWEKVMKFRITYLRHLKWQWNWYKNYHGNIYFKIDKYYEKSSLQIIINSNKYFYRNCNLYIKM